MTELIHVITYVAVAVFLIAVAVRFFKIRSYPVNMRWELYPLPHEGKRAEHGGSKMEETDYWAKPHKPDKIRELRYMLAEMVLIKGLWDHNRKLWWRSFPFHFGLYLLAGFAGLLVLSALVQLISPALFEPEVTGLGLLLNAVTGAVGALGFVLSIVGAIGLIIMRATDEDMKPYTNFSHFFNLIVILGVLVVAFLAFAINEHLEPWREYIASLITFNLAAPAVGTDMGALTAASIVGVSLLLAYIPLTHMSHFFVKWFTWHKIRWDDTPNVRGGRIEKMIQDALQYPVSWSADHIKGDGKKTWAQAATEEIAKGE